MLSIRRLDTTQVVAVYKEHMVSDFSSDELKQLDYIKRLLDGDYYHAIGFYRDEILVAYAFAILLANRNVLLVDYFAVLDLHRKTGIGKECLRLLQDMTQCTVIVEIRYECESEHYRNLSSFYRKSGFDRSGMYALISGVPFELWYLGSLGCAMGAEIMHDLYNAIYCKSDYMLLARV